MASCKRRTYFSAALEYNIMDDLPYEEIVREIEAGVHGEARTLTPADLGHTDMGVPVPIPTGRSHKQVIWVSKWVCININIRDDKGNSHVPAAIMPGRVHVLASTPADTGPKGTQ